VHYGPLCITSHGAVIVLYWDVLAGNEHCDMCVFSVIIGFYQNTNIRCIKCMNLVLHFLIAFCCVAYSSNFSSNVSGI